MREYMNIVSALLLEGDVVNLFPKKEEPKRSANPTLNDLLGEPQPVGVERMEPTPSSVHVIWDNFREADIPIFHVARMLKLKPGESAVLNAHSDNQDTTVPGRSLRVTRRPSQFIIGFDQHVVKPDDSLGVQPNPTVFVMDARAFTATAQQAIGMMKRD